MLVLKRGIVVGSGSGKKVHGDITTPPGMQLFVLIPQRKEIVGLTKYDEIHATTYDPAH